MRCNYWCTSTGHNTVPAPAPASPPPPARQTLTLVLCGRMGSVNVSGQISGSSPLSKSTPNGCVSRQYVFNRGATANLSFGPFIASQACTDAGCLPTGVGCQNWQGWSPVSGCDVTGYCCNSATVPMDQDRTINAFIDQQCTCPGPAPAPAPSPAVPPAAPPGGPCAAAMTCTSSVSAGAMVSARHILDIKNDYAGFTATASLTSRLNLSSSEWNQLVKGAKISAKYLRDLQQAVQRTNADLGNLVSSLESSSDISQYEANKKGLVKRSHINHLCSDLKNIRAAYNARNSCP